MKKSDLKTGMWVELRDGYKACVMLGTTAGDYITNGKSWASLSGYNNDLIDAKNSGNDVMRVCDSKYAVPSVLNGGLPEVWKRESEPIEMTLEEACKKLRDTMGKPVKITI
jgi:hypothetical protein